MSALHLPSSHGSNSSVTLFRLLNTESDSVLFRFLGIFSLPGICLIAYLFSLEFIIPAQIVEGPKSCLVNCHNSKGPTVLTFIPTAPTIARHSQPKNAPAAVHQGQGSDGDREVALRQQAIMKEYSLLGLAENAYAVALQSGRMDLDKVVSHSAGIVQAPASRISASRKGRVLNSFDGYVGTNGLEIGGLLMNSSDLGRASFPNSGKPDKVPSSVITEITRAEKNISRSNEAIWSVVRFHLPGLRHIYNRHLKTNPGMEGLLVVDFEIAPSGLVVAAKIENSRSLSSIFEKELVSAIKSWRFESIAGAGLESVRIPFHFSD